MPTNTRLKHASRRNVCSRAECVCGFCPSIHPFHRMRCVRCICVCVCIKHLMCWPFLIIIATVSAGNVPASVSVCDVTSSTTTTIADAEVPLGVAHAERICGQRSTQLGLSVPIKLFINMDPSGATKCWTARGKNTRFVISRTGSMTCVQLDGGRKRCWKYNLLRQSIFRHVVHTLAIVADQKNIGCMYNDEVHSTTVDTII